MVRGPPAGKPMSSITRIHLPCGVERFDVRRDRLDTRLVGRVHAGGGEIFDLAVQQQPERTAAIGLAQIEFETVHFGEAGERQQFEITEVAMSQQIGQHVVTVLIMRRGRRTRHRWLNYDFERRIWRIAGEIFVGINLDGPRDDRPQAALPGRDRRPPPEAP